MRSFVCQRRIWESCWCGSLIDYNIACMRCPAPSNILVQRKALAANGVRCKGKTCSKVDQLSLLMLGPRKKPELHVQASEARHFVPFLVGLLRQYQEHLAAGAFLLQAGEALQGYYALLEQHERLMPDASRIELMNLCLKHCTLMKTVASTTGTRLLPKHHLWYHLTAFW